MRVFVTIFFSVMFGFAVSCGVIALAQSCARQMDAAAAAQRTQDLQTCMSIRGTSLAFCEQFLESKE